MPGIFVKTVICVLLTQSGESQINGHFKVARDHEQQFLELAQKYKTEYQKYYEQSALKDKDPLQRYLSENPANTLVDDFLKLEEDSRGTKVGFSCLYHLVVQAGSVGEPDYPVSAGKAKALKRLSRHYVDYEDIDTVFRHLFIGSRRKEAKEFLRTLIESTSLEHVRANGLFALAECLANEANYPAILQSQLEIVDGSVSGKIQRQKLEKLIAEYDDIDPEVNRKAARALLQEVKSKYGKVHVSPQVGTRSPALIVVKRDRKDARSEKGGKRIVDRFPSVLFELAYPIGSKSPELTGFNSHGKFMRLADFRGKVVVLMFSFKGCGPCEAMYPANRKLVERLKDKPFAFLGVQGDDSLDTVNESIRSGEITWQVWWDGTAEEHSTAWNVRGWPAIFVLGKDGVIRFRDVRGEMLDRAVASLLDE